MTTTPTDKAISPLLSETMQRVSKLVDEQLRLLIPEGRELEGEIYQAMRYSTLNGGKRIRALLVMLSSRLMGVDEMCALRAAAAVECAHSYSLIHDDLPCMDDAMLRRGRPALHCEFDEATAVLAGDALQTLAFEILAQEETHRDARVRVTLVRELASALGAAGMAGGQMLDLIGETRDLNIGVITRMQRLKTGALIRFACESGAILGKASPRHRMALRNYAADIGQAYQMTDDLLDVTGKRQDMGKETKKDAKANKSTFVAKLGVTETEKKVRLLVDQAQSHLKVFDGKKEKQILVDLAKYVLERRR